MAKRISEIATSSTIKGWHLNDSEHDDLGQISLGRTLYRTNRTRHYWQLGLVLSMEGHFRQHE